MGDQCPINVYGDTVHVVKEEMQRTRPEESPKDLENETVPWYVHT